MKHLQSFYNNKNVLVTGGAGFIGSQIARALCSYGANVTVLDDLSTGSLENLENCKKKINFIANDITSFKTCLKATKKQDIVFHTAAFVSVPESVKHPELCEKINVEGTFNLLEAYKTNKFFSKTNHCFIFSSSAAVYGNKSYACNENDKPNPQSPYAQSKLAGEKLCTEYFENYGIQTAVLRYFNVYGKRQNKKCDDIGVVARFKENLLNKKPITIYGNGRQKRDFVHVSRVVQANLLASTLSLKGDIYNIATGKSITLLSLIKKLEIETNTKCAGIIFKPARKGDVVSSRADNKKYDTIVSQYSRRHTVP
jgi:UDP-glucose 4-epimerase